MKGKEERKLSQHLQGKFEMVRYLPGEFVLKGGRRFDTRKATVTEAREVIEKYGFKYLREINKKKEEAPATTGSKK